MIPSSFHFLRPDWLLALVPAALIVAVAARAMRQAGNGGWAALVDAHLLRHVSVNSAAARGSRAWLAALATGLVASVLAMAGPTWERLPVPVYGGTEPTVIVLSLAQSMNGTDLVPSRLARAGHKLRDMLDHVKGGDTALVIYADRPFVAAPLTADTEVIRQMLPELSTSLMPVLGNRLDLAVAEAEGLLTRAGATKGHILVIADDVGVDRAASLKAAEAARKAGYQLSVLGVGTTDGADLQTATGRAITAQDGSTITTRLDVAAMTGLAKAGGGRFSMVTPDNADIATLLPQPTDDVSAAGKQSDLVTDSWNDVGYLLVLLPALLAPFAFRRGLLFALPLILFGLGLGPTGARADGWADLWQTPDQQGQSAFESGDFAAAAAAFASVDHKAGALYRAGEFDAAAQVYASLPDRDAAPEAAYNLGNALAKAGKFEAALAAYDKVLAQTPDDADAIFNRDLVASLLEQQKQEQQQQDKQNKDQSQPQDNQQPQDQGSGQKDGEKAEDQAGSQPDQAPGSDSDDDQPGQENASQGGGSGNKAEGANAEPEQTEPGSDAQRNAVQQQGDTQDAKQTPGDQPGAPQPTSNDQSADRGTPDSAPAQATAGQSENSDRMPDAEAQTGQSSDAQQPDLKNLLDRALAGNGTPAEPTDDAPSAQGAGQPLDQATEQQLRAVPDDPSGLLRARIHQYYARLRAAGQ